MTKEPTEGMLEREEEKSDNERAGIKDIPRGTPPVDGFSYAAKLYQKVLQVMSKVERLKKDDLVQFGNTKYTAISEEKVTTALREAMVDAKLIIFPNNQVMNIREMIQDEKRTGYLTDINVLYKLCDAETGYSEFVSSSGTGVDSQDKGSGKAMTYAFKYALLRTFMIPTGEDPDKITSDQLTDEQEKLLAKTKKTTVDPKTTAPEEYLKATFPGTTEENPPTTETTSSFATDPEIVEIVNKAFPKNPEMGMRLVGSFKGEKAQLLTLLKSRIKE